MAFFNEFPHSRTYDSDLGWLIWAMQKLISDWGEFSNLNSIKFADPINWTIDRNYEPAMIVVDEQGNGYIARKPVPAGVPLSNDDYWTQIFNFGDITDTIRENIAVNAGESSTAPDALSKDELVWWNGNIYKVLYDIAAGTAFIPDVNVVKYTVDKKIQELYNDFLPYPIYYPSQELLVFSGSIGQGETITGSGDYHTYNADTQTMEIVHDNLGGN